MGAFGDLVVNRFLATDDSVGIQEAGPDKSQAEMDKGMSTRIDPHSWLGEWPKQGKTLVEAWSGVHVRYGFAAQEATNLETALAVLSAHVESSSEQPVAFDEFIKELEQTGSLTMGKLVARFIRTHRVDGMLQSALKVCVKHRNYLVHHFYRHQAEKFKTPNGCEELEKELFTIQELFAAAIDLLKDWKSSKSGGTLEGDALWDEINKNPEEFLRQAEAMELAIVGSKKP